MCADNAAALTAGAAVLAAAPPALADEGAVAVVEETTAITDAMELAVQSAEEAIKAAEQALESGRVDAFVVEAVHEAAEQARVLMAVQRKPTAGRLEEPGKPHACIASFRGSSHPHHAPLPAD